MHDRPPSPGPTRNLKSPPASPTRDSSLSATGPGTGKLCRRGAWLLLVDYYDSAMSLIIIMTIVMMMGPGPATEQGV
eukprot:1605287-Rhodomonas_salina.1